MADLDKKTLLIFLAIFIILIILVILTIIQINTDTSFRFEKLENVNQQTRPPIQAVYQSPGVLQSYNPVTYNDEGRSADVIKEYDYSKLYDPFIEPTRRIPRDQIPPFHLKRLIDIPTRGYPDNFTQYGILINNDKRSEVDDRSNNILRLFGRQEYPGSNRYEYYSAVNSGLDQIKIPLNVRRNELYDGDEVFIEELGQKYRVKLHKYDAPKYYPNIL